MIALKNFLKHKEIWTNWLRKAKIYHRVQNNSTKQVKKWTRVVANLYDFLYFYIQ